MKLFRPEKVYIEKEALKFPQTQKILKNLSGISTQEISDTRTLIEEMKQKRDPMGQGKRALLLAVDKGRSFKPFPEAEQYLSCDYFTLHVEEGCNLECSYCILQAYLTNPLITIYVNLEEMLENLQTILNQNPDRFFRIGTGQLSDSLSFDHITAFSETLVPFFANQSNALLELKTKSTNIERLFSLNPKSKTIISWSLNSKKIQKEEEHKCAAISERIEAAKKISKIDYQLGFHFDPIIDYAGWEKDYEEVIEELFKNIPEDKISWISLGCLRMMKELRPIMKDRFPRSKLPIAEWAHGMDGKLRYFKPARVEIYKKIVAMIHKKAPNLTLYLSMESPEVWRHVFGYEPTKDSICQMLDTAGKLVRG